MDCIFCKIAKGELESVNVYEDNDVLAFLDINPLTKGHCLVIPKMHYENIFDIDEEMLKKTAVVSKNLSEKISKNLRANGIRISQSNGKIAGQEVLHFHIHVIPRYEDDRVLMSDLSVARPSKVSFEELREIAEKIKT